MCFVRVKNNVASYTSDSQTTKTLSKPRAFWSPFSLCLSSATKEKQFRRAVLDSWIVLDFIGGGLGVLSAPLLFVSYRQELPAVLYIIWSFFSFVLAPLNIYSNFVYRKNRRSESRFWYVLFVRLVIGSSMIGLHSFVAGPISSIPGLFLHMLTKSPLLVMVIASWMHRLEFRFHVLVQSAALIPALRWIPLFCETCSTDLTNAQKFEEMGYGIDWLLSYTVLNREPDPAVYPCWMMTTFTVVVAGYILPCFFLFMSEIAARAAFLQSRVSHKFHFAIFSYANDAYRFGVLAALALTFTMWFALTISRDLLY